MANEKNLGAVFATCWKCGAETSEFAKTDDAIKAAKTISNITTPCAEARERRTARTLKMMSETTQTILGALAGILAAPAAWLALCVFLQLDVLFK